MKTKSKRAGDPQSKKKRNHQFPQVTKPKKIAKAKPHSSKSSADEDSAFLTPSMPHKEDMSPLDITCKETFKGVEISEFKKNLSKHKKTLLSQMRRKLIY